MPEFTNNRVATKEAQLEVIRRRANLGASSASFGADFANKLSPENPIAAKGGTELMTDPQIPSGGAEGSPVGGAVGQLKQEKGESMFILKEVFKRLKILSERGQ